MAERRPAYDEAERERIRRALQRYREEHKVGVPNLQLRIAEAIGDSNPDRVPLKSLQRFLAASHRTDDALVHHCAMFLVTVAPPPSEEVLSGALMQFLERDRDLSPDCSCYIGAYHGRFRTERPMWGDAYDTAYSFLWLRESGNTDYLNAEELVFNSSRDPDSFYRHPDIFRAEIRSRRRYSGIFLPYVGEKEGYTSFLLLLRNYMHMRYYLLSPDGGDRPSRLSGNGLEPSFTMFTGTPPWSSDFYIEFSPAPALSEAEENTVSNT